MLSKCQHSTTRAGLAVVLPLLCSGCLLFGNPCGNKSHSEEYLDHSKYIDISEIGTGQSDGTWLISPIDCIEACEQFREGISGPELLELDSCDLRIHPVLEDPARVGDNGSQRDWTSVGAIEEQVTVPAEWRTYETIIIAHCPGRYRVECR